MKTKPKTQLDFLKVYLITDRTLLPPDQFLKGIESALTGGVRAIQLREKDLSPKETLSLAREILPLTQNVGAKLFINDRADIADIAGADGIHLTESSMPVAEVKRRFPHLIAGVSTHSLDSAKRAEQQGADFITFSPIFDTPSKHVYGPPQGLDNLRQVADCLNIPVLALGGIKRDNITSIRDHDAFGIALISGIWKSQKIKETAYQFCQSFLGESS